MILIEIKELAPRVVNDAALAILRLAVKYGLRYQREHFPGGCTDTRGDVKEDALPAYVLLQPRTFVVLDGHDMPISEAAAVGEVKALPFALEIGA